MKQNFEKQGYPQQILKEAMQKCSELKQADLIIPKDKTESDIKTDTIYMVNTCRPCKDSLTATVRNNWPILGKSKTTKEIYRSKVVTSYRRPKNIRDHLIRAKTDYSEAAKSDEKEKTSNECNKINCKYCKMLKRDGQVKTHHNKTYPTKHNITCNSSNLIYCIECTECNIKYVGQTKRKIKDRIREHIHSVKKNNLTSDVPYHFNLEGHNIDKMRVHIVDFIYEHPDSKKALSLRNTIEFNWIHRLQTSAPQGLNTLDNRYG